MGRWKRKRERGEREEREGERQREKQRQREGERQREEQRQRETGIGRPAADGQTQRETERFDNLFTEQEEPTPDACIE